MVIGPPKIKKPLDLEKNLHSIDKKNCFLYCSLNFGNFVHGSSIYTGGYEHALKMKKTNLGFNTPDLTIKKYYVLKKIVFTSKTIDLLTRTCVLYSYRNI